MNLHSFNFKNHSPKIKVSGFTIKYNLRVAALPALAAATSQLGIATTTLPLISLNTTTTTTANWLISRNSRTLPRRRTQDCTVRSGTRRILAGLRGLKNSLSTSSLNVWLLFRHFITGTHVSAVLLVCVVWLPGVCCWWCVLLQWCCGVAGTAVRVQLKSHLGHRNTRPHAAPPHRAAPPPAQKFYSRMLKNIFNRKQINIQQCGKTWTQVTQADVLKFEILSKICIKFWVFLVCFSNKKACRAGAVPAGSLPNGYNV